MKQKSYITIIILIALLAITTGSALADGTVTGMSVSRAGGLTFTFSVTGYLSADQLNGGYVQVQGGDSFKLNCVQKDESTVVCHAPSKINAGVTVGFGGSTFWVDGGDMPQPSTPQHCYSVYDESLDTTSWQYQGTYCQENAASDGDMISFYSPYWEDTYNYYYYPEGVDAYDWPNLGAGYYYYSAN